MLSYYTNNNWIKRALTFVVTTCTHLVITEANTAFLEELSAILHKNISSVITNVQIYGMNADCELRAIELLRHSRIDTVTIHFPLQEPHIAALSQVLPVCNIVVFAYKHNQDLSDVKLYDALFRAASHSKIHTLKWSPWLTSDMITNGEFLNFISDRIERLKLTIYDLHSDDILFDTIADSGCLRIKIYFYDTLKFVKSFQSIGYNICCANRIFFACPICDQLREIRIARYKNLLTKIRTSNVIYIDLDLQHINIITFIMETCELLIRYPIETIKFNNGQRLTHISFCQELSDKIVQLLEHNYSLIEMDGMQDYDCVNKLLDRNRAAKENIRFIKTKSAL